MIRLVLASFVALMVVAGSAHAHDYSLSYDHFVKLYAPATFNGKTVVQAHARVGVLALPPLHQPGMPRPTTPYRPFWVGEQQIDLAKKGDHFFAKTRISVMEQFPGNSMGPVMLELTLTFSDGSKNTAKAESVHVTSTANTGSSADYTKALAEQQANYDQAQDATESSCATVSCYRRGPSY